MPQVTGTADWHINADEPVVLDYNTENKTSAQITSLFSSGPYRAADHDPLVIGLNLRPSTTTALGAPLLSRSVRLIPRILSSTAVTGCLVGTELAG
ncbi:MAG: hypothetical protein HC890_01270 [Chloroflexaceae bacterium]|nr:hypothetical protein [Chloroflexaceae bacterium]